MTDEQTPAKFVQRHKHSALNDWYQSANVVMFKGTAYTVGFLTYVALVALGFQLGFFPGVFKALQSRCLSEVSDFHRYSATVLSKGVVNLGILDRDVSLKLAFSGPFRDTNSRTSETTQNEGEEGHHNIDLKMPIIRRAIVLFLSFIVGALLSFFGWDYAWRHRDTQVRRGIGWALGFLGMIIFAMGLALWVALDIPRTWDWWL